MNVLREKLEKLQKEVEKYSDRSEPEEYWSIFRFLSIIFFNMQQIF